MTNLENIGIAGVGLYIPQPRMTASQISQATGGVWSEQAVVEKLGIRSKPVPGPEDGTQEMGARAALDALDQSGVDPKDIDVI
ncbi:MAG: hypothetical protein LBJ44_00165, partial [Propionibacteriaceae bacterium]|nr:hypothetical protein [Propionibacteriaceae bacterium]